MSTVSIIALVLVGMVLLPLALVILKQVIKVLLLPIGLLIMYCYLVGNPLRKIGNPFTWFWRTIRAPFKDE